MHVITLSLMDRHASRPRDTEPDLSIGDTDDEDFNVVPYHDALAAPSGQDQHALPPIPEDINDLGPVTSDESPRSSPRHIGILPRALPDTVRPRNHLFSFYRQGLVPLPAAPTDVVTIDRPNLVKKRGDTGD